MFGSHEIKIMQDIGLKGQLCDFIIAKMREKSIRHFET